MIKIYCILKSENKKLYYLDIQKIKKIFVQNREIYTKLLINVFSINKILF